MAARNSAMRRITLLCRIVDNLGDAGVSLRLARQWLHRHPQDHITLWTDLPSPFAALLGPKEMGDAKTTDLAQTCTWHPASLPGLTIAEGLCPPADYDWGDVIIEAFGTPIPEPWKQRLGLDPSPPVWINLEYLSAEPWVASCHGLTSTDPTTGWKQHFFYPGFTPDTGGLLGEEACDVVNKSIASDTTPNASEFRVFVFAYSLTPLRHWIQAGKLAGTPQFCIPGRSDGGVSGHRNGESTRDSDEPSPTEVTEHSMAHSDGISIPQVSTVAFVPQIEFDTQLRQYDWLFVRGEDSFVRAQLAGKPMVWQIYPTDDGAHWTKLRAFFELYSAGLGPDTKAAWWDVWLYWNQATDDVGPDRATAIWNNACRHRGALQDHAVRWQSAVKDQARLIERLTMLIDREQAAWRTRGNDDRETTTT